VVNSDNIVLETREQLHASGVPGQRVACEDSFLGSLAFFLVLAGVDLDVNVSNDWFILISQHVVDFESTVAGNCNPLHLWVESNGVDGAADVEFTGWLFEVVDAPNTDVAVLATGGEVSTVWCNGEGVDE